MCKINSSVWCIEKLDNAGWEEVRNHNGHIITYATEEEAEKMLEIYNTRFSPVVRIKELTL